MVKQNIGIIQILFIVVMFITLVATGYSTLTSTTTDTDTIETFATPTTNTSFVTLTGSDSLSINNVTNSTTGLIVEGNYTYYAGNNTLMILDNSVFDGGVLTVNYVNRPSGYISGTTSVIVFLVILLVAIVFLTSLTKKSGR